MHKELILKVAGPPRSSVPLRPPPAHQSTTHSALLQHPMHPSLGHSSVLPSTPTSLSCSLSNAPSLQSFGHPTESLPQPPWNPSCRHQDLLEVCCENVVRAETQSSQKPQATGRRVPQEEPSITSIRPSQQFICSTAK